MAKIRIFEILTFIGGVKFFLSLGVKVLSLCVLFLTGIGMGKGRDSGEEQNGGVDKDGILFIKMEGNKGKIELICESDTVVTYWELSPTPYEYIHSDREVIVRNFAPEDTLLGEEYGIIEGYIPVIPDTKYLTCAIAVDDTSQTFCVYGPCFVKKCDPDTAGIDCDNCYAIHYYLKVPVKPEGDAGFRWYFIRHMYLNSWEYYGCDGIGKLIPTSPEKKAIVTFFSGVMGFVSYPDIMCSKNRFSVLNIQHKEVSVQQKETSRIATPVIFPVSGSDTTVIPYVKEAFFSVGNWVSSLYLFVFDSTFIVYDELRHCRTEFQMSRNEIFRRTPNDK